MAVSANRMTDRIQLYTDGMLNIYAPATEYGQIAAGYIYTGVTPVAENGTNVNVEKYWNGSLDDVRFWNLYKNEKAVANYRHEPQARRQGNGTDGLLPV